MKQTELFAIGNHYLLRLNKIWALQSFW